LTKDTSQHLADLREHMAALELDALIVPRADEYLGEYLPAHNERMEWVSGFTGSAGMVIVLRDSAAIFVDGRYTVQVRQQVDESHFEILHLVDEPHLPWLAAQLPDNARVGCDTRTHPWNWYQQALKTLQEKSIALVSLEQNLIDLCWQDRPTVISHPALLLEEKYTGQPSLAKRREIGELIGAQGADAAYIFAADSVAWLLNIRGRDVPSLPLVLGSALLHSDGKMVFFTDPAKIPAGFAAHVGEGVEVLPEGEAAAMLASLPGHKVLVDPATANAWCQLTLRDSGVEVIAGDDPVLMPKACKNEVEVQGMREAHIRDGVAEVQFLAWLDAEVDAGRLHDEATLADALYEFRAGRALFQETSFDTISAAGGNAAMCHYNHLNGNPATLTMNSVYLVDSGGQYLDGTTDITRTVAIGDPGEEPRRMNTLVLKGHIALDQARFPEGTTGTQLDVLARQFLWQEGLDYDHGTGHGVGTFLSVHEGPHRIGKAHNGAALQSGMVVSNEPGYYKTDAYGMRCENLLVVREMGKAPDSDKQSLGFEVLTLAPFDLRMIDASLFTEAEKNWLNNYHQKVLTTLSPHLDESNQAWLQQATRSI
jgi:Xaa-Pro aminopeptidase